MGSPLAWHLPASVSAHLGCSSQYVEYILQTRSAPEPYQCFPKSPPQAQLEHCSHSGLAAEVQNHWRSLQCQSSCWLSYRGQTIGTVANIFQQLPIYTHLKYRRHIKVRNFAGSMDCHEIHTPELHRCAVRSYIPAKGVGTDQTISKSRPWVNPMDIVSRMI